jgi:hypothetical protein
MNATFTATCAQSNLAANNCCQTLGAMHQNYMNNHQNSLETSVSTTGSDGEDGCKPHCDAMIAHLNAAAQTPAHAAAVPCIKQAIIDLAALCSKPAGPPPSTVAPTHN